MSTRAVESRLTACPRRRAGRISFVAFLFIVTIAQTTRTIHGYGAETVENTVVTLSAASFEVTVAPESIVAMFGAGLATGVEAAATIPLPKVLAGTRVKVKDTLGVEREAGLLFASPTQINCVIPPGTAMGEASIAVVAGDGAMSNGTVEVASSAPGIFTASSDGKGVPAAIVLHYYPDTTFTSENAFQDSQGGLVPRPIDLGPPTDSVFLVLFGTGIRGAPGSVKVLIGGLELAPDYAGNQPNFEGLDQVNLLIDRSLIGKGQIQVSVVSDGFGDSNLVDINIASPPGPQPPTVTGISGPQNLLVQDLITLNGTMFSSTPDENTVRIGGVDATVEVATTTQLKARVGFGSQTGPITVATSGGTWTSPASQQVRTSMSGLVRDTNNQPVPGALVSLLVGNTPVPTSSEGSYILPDTPGGAPPSGQLIGFKVVSTVTPPDGLPYPLTYPQKMEVVAQRDNPYEGAIYLQEANGPGYTIGDSGGSGFSGATASRVGGGVDPMISIAGVTLTLPGVGLSAIFPGGATTGTIVLDVLKDSLTPAPMPPAIFSSSVAQITPFGVQLTPGAKLTFPNLDGFTADAQLRLYKYDLAQSSPTLGTFVDTGKPAFVTANGSFIETEANAITEASLYFVAVARPLTTVTGRVVDSDGVTPRRGAIVRARGRETRSDGNGGFVLRLVSAIDGLPIPVTASFLRPGGRVDGAFKLSPPAEIKGLTRAGNLVLSSVTSNRAPLIYVKTYLEVYSEHILAIPATIIDLDETLPTASFSGPGLAQFTNTGLPGAYMIRVAPHVGQEGTYVLAITATDSGGLTTRREITLVVKPLPVANSRSVQTNEDQAVQIAVSGSDAESRPLTFKLKMGPQNGALSALGPTFTYTPRLNFSGQDSFTFVVDNGLVESLPATVSITVVPVNDPPVIVVPGAQTVNTGNLLTFGVNASDGDPNQTLTLTASNLPTGAVFTQNGPTTGTFSWTPAGAQVGAYSVNFTATDNGSGSLSDTKAVTITVANPIWRPTSGPPGGSITAFANPGGVILAGTEGNGIFRSADNAVSWLGANSGLGNPFVTSFATIPAAIFAGTEGGVYRSVNGGQTWTAINSGLTNTNVRALTVAAGTLYAGTEGGGVFMFTAETSSWIATNASITNLSVRALTSIGEVVYAANALGVFVLLPGQPWSQFSTGLPAARVVSFALRNTPGGIAIIAGTQGAGVYQRLAGGGNWSSLNQGLGNLVVNAVALGVGDSLLFAGTQGEGMFRFDFAALTPTWAAVNNGLTHPLVRSVIATAQASLAGSNGGGIFRTLNNGNNWSPANEGIPRAVVNYLVSNQGTLFAATTGGGVYASGNNGATWTGVNTGLQNLVVATLAVSGGNLLAGTVGSGVYRSVNGGVSWNTANSGLGDLFIQSLALNGNVGFAGTDVGTIWVTSDAGTSWSPASNGLGGSAVYAIFVNGAFTFAGTNRDGIYRSSNNGGNWSPANNGLGSLRVSSFAANAGSVFAGTLDGGVYRSTDNGASWSPVNNGILEPNIYSLLVSGNNIYAASRGGGVFVSSNGGNSWSAINQGLSFPFVLTLTGNGSAIFAGTDGSGVFILE